MSLVALFAVGTAAANPVIEGTFADPYALYAEGTGRYYLYPTQDMPGWGAYDLKVYSSADLKTWRREGIAFDLRKDCPWSDINLWAPTVHERRQADGSYRYYLYYTAKGGIGVAVASNPAGPFKEALGRPLVPGGRFAGMTVGQNIDPDVFRDPKSGKTYLYYGNSFLICAELGEDLTSIVSEKVLMKDTERGKFHYSEGPHVFCRKGLYYFTWSENDTRNPDYRVRYLISDSPTAFVRNGKPASVEPTCVVSKDVEKDILGTGHHSVVRCHGTDDWRIFYHRLPPGKFKELGWRAGYYRQTCMDELKFTSDGHIEPVQVTQSALAWPEPTMTMKPWAYNWWMGSAVDAAGLEAQCRELEEKGFGGFHVVPIYGAKGYERQWKTLLSPEWIEAWNLAAATAKKHGLGIDLTMGAGWCFGGPWVTPEDAASSGMKVKRAGLGGEGFMIDPFSPKAMSNHVARFEAAFGKNGTAARPRAFYHDSYEYFNAKPKDGRDPADAQVACFKVWTDWCRANGYLSRNEGHGAPSNWLDLYALADIPETEMFGRECRDILVSKFASSAAHLTGKRLVSAEGCTWIDEHFHEKPSEIKSVIDRLFLSGVNHFFFHGCCYSPVDAVWPGWCFYASVEMNPRNPIWREIGTLTAYITRCQSVFQTWTPDNDLVLLFDPPYTGDPMSVHGAPRWFYGKGGLGPRAKELYEAGYQFDYASPRMLKANPSLTNRMDVAKARKSPFGGLDGVRSQRFAKDGETLYFVVSEKHRLLFSDERPFAVMDPMTGEIREDDRHWLEKGASCFVRTNRPLKVYIVDDVVCDCLSFAVGTDGWKVTPIAGGPTLSSPTNIALLVGWTAWDEAFSGTMLYETAFDSPAPALHWIDLGEVREIARVHLNGRDLGCKIMPPYRFAIPAGVLKSKDNRLEVEVTNLGANRLRWNDLNGVKWKYFTDINMVGYNYLPLDASKWSVQPSGLLGPVNVK